MSFHWRDGWNFERGEGGTVSLWNEALKIWLEIPPNEWASIVASVVPGGETSESYRAALAVHNGERADAELVETLGGALAAAREAHSVPRGGPAFGPASDLASMMDVALGRYMGWRTDHGRLTETEKQSGFVDVPPMWRLRLRGQRRSHAGCALKWGDPAERFVEMEIIE